MDEIERYVQNNRERLKILDKHSEPVVRSMVLAILKVGNQNKKRLEKKWRQ